jgi:RNA polymerase sigma factor (sigma-70 family)
MRVEDKQDLIQDIIIKLFQKEEEGVLSTEIEKNKNYIFISIKNLIHYRLYTKKNLVDYKPDFNETMILSYPTIENDMDKEIRYNELQNLLKSNKFSYEERTLIDLTFKGYELQDIGNELNLDERRIYAIHTNLKSKIKFRLFPNYKYLLIYENGNTIGIKSQNELTRKTGMSKDKILLGFKLGKTKYKNYEIIKL